MFEWILVALFSLAETKECDVGVSTDAMLFYGYDYPEGDYPWEPFDNDPELWLKATGYTGPVEIGMHCSYGYPMYYVRIEEFVNGRGDVTMVAGKDGQIKTNPAWAKALKYFALKTSTHFDETKVGWHLVSFWGQ